ncbi:putative HTH-type transcriptional regulator YtcD [Corynebacterium faecale]|uniref:winged helix-turn-helix transcriptional regulator n=1 Tax=Corynebacterium faecale TaxID=1758466 RepID=UPI0025B3E21A|nr:helix-turn-helix domain-containing protein [Corynebacterium faecale]WJY92646.1 putative HTH-type transcriptional regulator YtcD [Corynebacterium faecale]
MRLLNETPRATVGVDAAGRGVTAAETRTRQPVQLVPSPHDTQENTPPRTSADPELRTSAGANDPGLSWDPFNKSCLSRDLFDTIGDKWAMLILLSIEDGPLRNGEIKDRVEGISPKVLTQRLSVLVEDGLVTRTSHHQIPPRVDYELTELGESVVEPVKGVYAWTVAHMDKVMASRTRHPKAS